MSEFKQYLRESLNEQTDPGDDEYNPYPDPGGIPYYLPVGYQDWPYQFPGGYDWDDDGIPDDVYIDDKGNIIIVSGATGQIIHRTDDPLFRPDRDPFGRPLDLPEDGEIDEYGWQYYDDVDEDGVITRYSWNPITGEWEIYDTIFPPGYPSSNPDDISPAKLRYLEWLLQQDLNGDGFIPASNPNVVPDNFKPFFPGQPYFPDMIPAPDGGTFTPEAPDQGISIK